MNSQLLQEIDMLHASICEALADPKRIAILYVLRDEPMTVNEMAKQLAVPQATMSRHLKILRERRLLRARREGMNVYYALTNRKVLDALDLLRQVLNENLVFDATLARVLEA